jgi:hypothetical protein
MTVPSERVVSQGRWERLAPLSGVVAVILFVVGSIVFEVVGDTPDDDATAQQYLSYFRDEDGSIWVGAWIFLLGAAFFVWFLGTLRAALYRAEGGIGRIASIAYAGGVGAVLLFAAVIAASISGAIAAEDGENLSPEAAQALWWVGNGFFVTATFFLAAFYAASAVLFVRTRVLPVWFGVVTAILALASAIPFISWAVLLFATPLWTSIVAIWLFVRPPVIVD